MLPDIIDSITIGSGDTSASKVATIAGTTPEGISYRQQLKALNYLSYSVLQGLHSCPRMFFLNKALSTEGEERDDNPDFLYGHAVAAGVQSFIAFHDREQALLECFIAWNGSLDTEKLKSKKSIWFAVAAVEKFILMADSILNGWQVAMIDDKPAVELAFAIDLENGYHYLGHIDLILWHPSLQQFMVLELKTTSFSTVNEASYKNSNQAIGYSIVLDALAARMNISAEGNKNYQLLYLIYKTGAQEYEPMLFTKTRTARATWLHDTLVDCSIINLYQEQEHYPMRGESCYAFFRPCEYFGLCDMKSLQDQAARSIELVASGDKIAGVDYYFKLSEIIGSELGEQS